MDRTSNPGLYRRLSEPHESVEAANAAIREFDSAIAIIREQYRIPDVIVICGVIAMRDQVEIDAQVTLTYGDSAHHEIMIARALGQLQGERQRRLTDALRERAIMIPGGGG